VLVGGYETLLEQHVAGRHDTDLVCFTDDPDARSDTWQIRHLPTRFPLDQNRSSRRPKLLAHEYLAEYDESLYIDNSTLLLVDPGAIFDALLPADESMAVLRHSFRPTLRDEFAAVIEQRRDAAWICEEQLAHYEQIAPGLLERPPLWGGLLLRRHHVPQVREAMQAWWEHVLRYSRRDQLSLPAALSTVGLKPIVHQIDNHISPFHEWPRGAAQRDHNGGAPLPPGPAPRIAQLEQQVAELHQSMAALQSELATASAAAAHRDVLASVLEEVRSSTSWRVTRPLRWMRDRLNAARAARRPDA
jgi:hypothetical protein